MRSQRQSRLHETSGKSSRVRPDSVRPATSGPSNDASGTRAPPSSPSAALMVQRDRVEFSRTLAVTRHSRQLRHQTHSSMATLQPPTASASSTSIKPQRGSTTSRLVPSGTPPASTPPKQPKFDVKSLFKRPDSQEDPSMPPRAAEVVFPSISTALVSQTPPSGRVGLRPQRQSLPSLRTTSVLPGEHDASNVPTGPMPAPQWGGYYYYYCPGTPLSRPYTGSPAPAQGQVTTKSDESGQEIDLGCFKTQAPAAPPHVALPSPAWRTVPARIESEEAKRQRSAVLAERQKDKAWIAAEEGKLEAEAKPDEETPEEMVAWQVSEEMAGSECKQPEAEEPATQEEPLNVAPFSVALRSSNSTRSDHDGPQASSQAKPMSAAETLALISDTVRKFLSTRDLQAILLEFKTLPVRLHGRFIDALVFSATEADSADDVELVCAFFCHAVADGVCAPAAIEEGLTLTAGSMCAAVVEAPRALEWFGMLLRASGLEDDKERVGRLLARIVDVRDA